MDILAKASELYEQGFSVIPTNVRKAPTQSEWTTKVNDNREKPNGNFKDDAVTGVGVVLGAKIGEYYLAAIDVDCYDKDVSRKMCDYIAQQTPTKSISYRVGQAPKFLVPYLSTHQVIKKNSVKFLTDDGLESFIEVLGKGQQFVAYGGFIDKQGGKHVYRWFNGDLSVEQLPVFDDLDIVDIISHFENLASGQMAQITQSVNDPFEVIDDDPFIDAPKPTLELDDVQVGLYLQMYPSEGLDYDRWVEVGMALSHQYNQSDEGYQTWLKWSEQSSKHDPAFMRRKWESFDNDGRQVTFATIIKRAKASEISLADDRLVVKESIFRRMTDDLLTQPHHVRWVVKGILERGIVAQIFGPPGVGKSFITIDMACSIAANQDWYGHKVRGGEVLYIAGEGFSGVTRRVYGWRMENNMASVEGLTVTQRALNFGVAKDLDMLRDYLDSCEESPRLIVIDTLSRATAGMSENDAMEMAPFMERLSGIARKYDCTVLTVHHSPKAATTESRGSSAIKGALDAEIRVTKESSGLIVDCNKMKDAEYFEPMGFKLISVQLPSNFNDEDGEPTTTAVLKMDQSVTDNKDKSLKLSTTGAMVLKAFDAVYDDDRITKAPTPHDIVVAMGMDAPSDGLWLSDVRDYFNRMNSDASETTVRQRWKRGLDDAISKDILVSLDEVIVKL